MRCGACDVNVTLAHALAKEPGLFHGAAEVNLTDRRRLRLRLRDLAAGAAFSAE